MKGRDNSLPNAAYTKTLLETDFNNHLEIMLLFDSNMNILFASHAARNILLSTFFDSKAKVHQLLPFFCNVLDDVQEVFEHKTNRYGEISSHDQKDPKVFAYHLDYLPDPVEDFVVATFEDTSAMAATKYILSELESNLINTFQTSPFVMSICRQSDGTYLNINQAHTNATGNKLEDLVNRNSFEWRALKNTNDTDPLVEEKVVPLSFYDLNNIKKEGLLYTFCISYRGIPSYLFMIEDITDKNRYRETNTRYEQLHVAGQLAAGISHEIRNPIATIRGILQLMKKDTTNNLNNNYLDVLIGEVDRTNELIANYMSLTRNPPCRKEEKQLHSILCSLQPLIEADCFLQGIDTEFKLDSSTQTICCDESQIKQVILNLCRNGCEAMVKGGKLTIEVSSRNGYVNLIVRDQGSGLSDHAIEHMKKPFFTTKDNGTGLGIPICYQIAADHNAKLTFDTSPKGTCFILSFPDSSK